MDVSAIKPRLLPVLEKYRVTSCYLFGSRAGQEYYRDSDIDLAVIFEHFSGKEHNLAFEIDMQNEISDILAPLPVDLLFLQKAPVYLKFNVISSGQVIFSKNDDFRTDFEDITIRDYLDFKPVLDMYYREMADAILEESVVRDANDQQGIDY